MLGRRIDEQETRVHTLLREAIITGGIQPGERLVERDLAEKFAASRTPVRAAIKRLAAEGLVDQSPNRGAVVKRLSIADTVQLLYVREALEAMACRLAAENGPRDAIARLLVIVDRMEKVTEASDFVSYYRLSGEFHALIHGAAANGPLSKLVDQVNIQVARFQFRNLLLAGRIPESVAEHREIAQAIAAGDADRAEAAIRRHISIVRDLIVKKAQSPEYLAL